ncbi:MAG: Fe-S cluster assembly protein SufD [Scytonematopsis contorta HA4267-MV1]|jgi:Fe-S cluster assembly protein SufD|nr:Fe-S cluster assembly protein SufD [Scytonematopsis contorta HA4267-MV1]
MVIKVSPSPIPNSSSISLPSAVLEVDTYLKGLLDKVTVKKSQGWVQELRERAANWVRHSSVPSKRDEEWRFTDLSPLLEVQFDVETRFIASLPIASLQNLDISPETSNCRLVFVNGVYAPELSAVSGLPAGVLVSNLTNLSGGYAERAREYLAQAEGTMEVFTALNTAGMLDAAVVWVDKNVVFDTPIHLVFVSTAGEMPTVSLPRCLVVAETGSQVSFLEEFTEHITNHEGTKDTKGKSEKSVYFCNAVTEVWVADNAYVNHVRVQRDAEDAFHIGKTAVTQGRYSRYTSTAIVFGGKVSRHNLEILQTGEQTETTLNGLTMISGNQVADTHSAIALNYPYGVSRQLYKCIVGDRAHGVFNGKVFVPKLAQQTEASQLNRNLLLSSKARVDTKPQLEITADNVKCAHGATVSQLEDDEIFYLQSRGIDEDDARHLLVNAFAAEIINNISVPSLRESLTSRVTNLKSISNDR